MNHIIQFDNIDYSFNDDIDETFYQWCITNNVDYISDDEDYPDSFKEYYVLNVYPHSIKDQIAY